MKGYYLRIKTPAYYERKTNALILKRFIQARKEVITAKKWSRIKKRHNRMRARNREYVLARHEHRISRIIRGERDYSKGLKNGN